MERFKVNHNGTFHKKKWSDDDFWEPIWLQGKLDQLLMMVWIRRLINRVQDGPER